MNRSANLGDGREKSRGGFTLVEILFSFVIFAIVMTGVVWTLITAQRMGQSARNRLTALQHARDSMEEVISLGYNSSALLEGTHSVTRGGWQGSYVVSEPVTAERKRVRMSFSYPSFGSTDEVELQMDVSNALH